MEINIPTTKVNVVEQTDVLVCGAGSAGISAAVSAARHDCQVVLLERWPSVGGMATNALVNGWHRSDREKVVINGLVEESVKRAEKHGWILRDSGKLPEFNEGNTRGHLRWAQDHSYWNMCPVAGNPLDMVMGQGVGTAIALALQNNKNLSEIDITSLQRELKKDEVYIQEN